jgi:manganese transport protein
VPIIIISLLLLLAALIYPILMRKDGHITLPHGTAPLIPAITAQHYSRIGICVDFSNSDTKAITHGISQGNADTVYHIIHIVESAMARATGEETRDYETHQDWLYLQSLCSQLRDMGYVVQPQIGFGLATRVIPKITAREQLDMLVIGSHGHAVIQDIIFGETISTVRHRVKCPVLVV